MRLRSSTEAQEGEQQHQKGEDVAGTEGRRDRGQDQTPAQRHPQPQPPTHRPVERSNSGRRSHAPLHTAIAKQDLKLCLQLVEDERHVNALDERDNSTPLHALARRKSKGEFTRKVAEALLKKGAKVNDRDKAGLTPLHVAARDGRYDLCECLLNHLRPGKDRTLNVRSENSQQTPLHYAAVEGQSKIVELLLEAGADPKLPDKSGWLPVHHAANKGHKDCCRLLASSYTYQDHQNVPPPIALTTQKGYYRCCKELAPDEGSLRYRDGSGNTPLHVVSKKGFSVFVEGLLDLKAPVDEPNSSGNTPIMEAVRNNKLHCVKLLAEGGASLAEKNREHNTVLHIAAASKAHKCLEYLLGCKNIEDQLNEKNDHGQTALAIAVEKQDEKNVNRLIMAGASPTCGPGKPLLLFSFVYKQPGILQKILSCDSSDINRSDENGVTPLHLAAEEGSKASCCHLLRRGARLNAFDNNGRSPLHVAAAAGHAEAVRFLVNSRAELRTKDHDRHFTALHAAAAAGSRECSAILLDADQGHCKEKAGDGRYALDVAFQGGHHDIVRLLLEKFKQLPEDLRLRLHAYTHRSVASKDRGFLSVMFDSKWWKTGCGLDRAEGAAPCPNFRDIIRLYPDLASKVMTKCRDGFINDLRLLENTSYARTGDKDGTACLSGSGQQSAEMATLENHPVGVMVHMGYERLALLQHPLVERWLDYKWGSYARWLFLMLLLWRLFTVAALFFFLLYTENWAQIEKKHGLTREEMCGPWLGSQGHPRKQQDGPVPASWTHPGVLDTAVAHLLLTASLVLQVFVEWMCFRKTRKHYVDGSFFVLRLPCMVLSLAALLPTSTCDLILGIKSVYAWECCILALLLSWLDLIHNINQLPQFTMFAQLNVNFLKGYVKGLMYLGMVVFIFSFAFHLLLWEQASFRSLPQSMVQVVVWMVGDLNYDDNFLNANLDYPLLSTSLFLLFVCTVGAFFVSLIKTPSSSKKRLRYLKQTGRINLLLKIDICFPWFRNLCLAQHYDETEKIPSLFTKLQEHFSSLEQTDGGKPETSQHDGPTPEPALQLYTEKLISFLENVGEFFQTDDNDDDDESDHEADDLRTDLKLVKGMLEEQAKQLQQILQDYEERSSKFCEEIEESVRN